MYRYAVYGIIIEAAFECPDLVPGTGPPDVTISLGETPSMLPDAAARGIRYEAAPGHFLLTVDDVARYFVRDGREVVVEQLGGDMEDVRLFLMGPVFAALMHQREQSVLHASVIRHGDSGIAFAGLSGTGKSTLAAAFQRRGHDVLTDDLCALTFDAQGAACAQPGYARLMLWANVLQHFGLPYEEMRPVRRGLFKYVYPLGGSFHEAPLPLRCVVVLSQLPQPAMQCHPIGGPPAFRLLGRHTYGFDYVAALGRQQGHFRQMMTLAQQVRILGLHRTADLSTLDDLVALLEEHFAA